MSKIPAVAHEGPPVRPSPMLPAVNESGPAGSREANIHENSLEVGQPTTSRSNVRVLFRYLSWRPNVLKMGRECDEKVLSCAFGCRPGISKNLAQRPLSRKRG